MNARSADFAATAPWSGITGKPSAYPTDPALLSAGSARDQSLLVFDSAQARWVPVTPQNLLVILLPFLHLTAADVGLGEVDNTSDTTKNAATAILTNKTLLGAVLQLTLQLGLRSPTGFNLFLATDSELSTDRTLTLRLSDDADHSLDLLGGNLVVSMSDGTGTDETRTLALGGDLTLRGGDLVVELTDGTGTGEDRVLTLERDLSLVGGGNFTISVDTDTVLNLNGDVTISGSFTTVGGSAAILTFTGITAVTFPTTGTLANTTYVDAGDAATLAAANSYTDSAVASRQPLTGNSFTVAGLPAAASNVGRCVYCSNGSAGAPCAAISDGTNWKVIAIGATVST